MAIALVAKSSTFTTANANGTVSAAIDSTGANLLVAIVTQQTVITSVGALMTDSKSNSGWTLAQLNSESGHGGLDLSMSIYYCENPSSVGSSHTATFILIGSTPGIIFLAFSGAKTSGALDVSGGVSDGGNGTTVQPGSLTPNQNGSLAIAFADSQSTNNVTGVDSSFTLAQAPAGGTGSRKVDGAYFIQTSAAALNPTFTFNKSSNNVYAGMAIFKPSTGTVDSGAFFLLI